MCYPLYVFLLLLRRRSFVVVFIFPCFCRSTFNRFSCFLLFSSLLLLLLLLQNSTHYEDPKPNGCRADEEAIQIAGVSGDFCTPECIGTSCPQDVPAGVTATPTCALQDSSGNKFCALMCDPISSDAQCGNMASCKPVSGVGICTYDD